MGKARKRFEVFEGAATIDLPIEQRGTADWYWRLKSGNSKIIAVGGEPFSSVGSAVKAVQRMNNMLTEKLPIEVL